MTEPLFDTLLTTMTIATTSFSIVAMRRGEPPASARSDMIEIHYVLAGTLCLKVGGKPEITGGPGTMLLVPPGLDRTIGAAADSADLRLASGRIVARLGGAIGLLESVRGPLVADLGDLPVIAQSCLLAAAALGGAGTGSRALADALIKVCVVTLLQRTYAGSGPDAGLFQALRDPRLGRAIDAIIANPAAPHSVASLAGAASMSRSAFAREFAASLAMTPMAFVARTRLQQGADLLNATRLPVKMIAANIGFASRSHFSRAFSAAYGADPSSFRRAERRRGRNEAVPARLPAPLLRIAGGQ